jgi:hypothetical protein
MINCCRNSLQTLLHTLPSSILSSHACYTKHYAPFTLHAPLPVPLFVLEGCLGHLAPYIDKVISFSRWYLVRGVMQESTTFSSVVEDFLAQIASFP